MRRMPGAQLPDLPPPLKAWVEWLATTDKSQVTRKLSLLAPAQAQHRGERQIRIDPFSTFLRNFPGLGSARIFDATHGAHVAAVKAGFTEDTDPSALMFHGARLATFLPYRRGLATAFGVARFEPAQALHAYLRVLLVWAKQWGPILRCSGNELETRKIEWRKHAGKPAVPADQARILEITFPAVAEWDLLDLFATDRNERGDVEPAAGADVATTIMLQQARHAAVRLVADPSLPVLTAYNFVRESANMELGGTLTQLSLRGELSAEAIQLTTAILSLPRSAHADLIERYQQLRPAFENLFARS